ncbi:MAG: response regulator, partial [Chthoniobacterales bacterium]|nr:response regulator [Chthoniobacterales bacterium]
GLLEVAGFTQQNNETAKLANLRLLLAEDTSFFREAVLRALQHVVAKLDLANDGEEAWKMLNEKEYDVLITDIEMPKLDGFALTERIRSSTKLCSLPVIALSARDSESFLNRAKQVGIDHYETKFDRDRIIAAVLKVISQQNE